MEEGKITHMFIKHTIKQIGQNADAFRLSIVLIIRRIFAGSRI